MSTLLTNDEIISAVGLPKSVVDGLQSALATEYEAASNEFLNAIVNKIVLQKAYSFSFSNPFAKYDGEPIDFGDTIENVYIDIQPGYKFNPDATDPFAKTKPAVKATYPHINYAMQYAITIERDLLRRACLRPYGFNDIINRILNTLVTKREIDEYSATIISLNNAANFAKGIEDVDVTSAAGDVAKQMDIVVHTMVNTYNDFPLPSNGNNKMGVVTATPKQNALMIIKQSLLNNIDLDYLKGIFNLDKVDIVKNIMPVRSFMTVVNTEDGALTPSATGGDIDFMIIDDRGFDNHINLRDGGSIYNPKGRYTNYFVDSWKIFGYKPFFNARAFKLKTK